MLNRIAEIVGVRYNEMDPIVMDRLTRIANLIPEGVKPEDTYFANVVAIAEDRIAKQGNQVMDALAKSVTAGPVEKVLKIKSSPKGARIKIAAANGVRYSFGPIWNASILKGKGIALVEANRPKLNHQALMLGIVSPEKMKIESLVAKLAPLVA